MKTLAQRILERGQTNEGLDRKQLADIKDDLLASFDEKDFEKTKTFDKFWAQVDVLNAYEEEWEEEKDELKPYYKAIWDEYKSGKLFEALHLRTKVRGTYENMNTNKARLLIREAAFMADKLLDREHPSPNPASDVDRVHLTEARHGMNLVMEKLKKVKESKKAK